MNKELSRYQSSLTKHVWTSSWPLTYINVMRNKDSHLKIKTKLETTLGYQLESHAETGLWVEKGKQPVLSFSFAKQKESLIKSLLNVLGRPPQASSKDQEFASRFFVYPREKYSKVQPILHWCGLSTFMLGNVCLAVVLLTSLLKRLQRQFKRSNRSHDPNHQCEEESLDSFKCAGHVTYSRTHV